MLAVQPFADPHVPSRGLRGTPKLLEPQNAGFVKKLLTQVWGKYDFSTQACLDLKLCLQFWKLQHPEATI